MTRNKIFLLIGAGALVTATFVVLFFPTARFWEREGKMGSVTAPRVAINGTVHVLTNDHGEISMVVIVDTTGVETLISKEDELKLTSLDQKQVDVTGNLKTGMAATAVRRDSAGNKVPISMIELSRLPPDRPVELGLGEVRILTGMELTAKRSWGSVLVWGGGVCAVIVVISAVLLHSRRQPKQDRS